MPDTNQRKCLCMIIGGDVVRIAVPNAANPVLDDFYREAREHVAEVKIYPVEKVELYGPEPKG